MKIWNKTHHLTDTNLILNETFTEDAFFFDIETTGLSPLNCEITEIGAVRMKSGKLIDDRLCAPCG